MPLVRPENPRPVRAKMYVNEVTYHQYGVRVVLRVVSRGEDNKKWAAASPDGSLTILIKNEAASDQFAPDQEWYVDMTPVPADQHGKEGMGDVDFGDAS